MKILYSETAILKKDRNYDTTDMVKVEVRQYRVDTVIDTYVVTDGEDIDEFLDPYLTTSYSEAAFIRMGIASFDEAVKNHPCTHKKQAEGEKENDHQSDAA